MLMGNEHGCEMLSNLKTKVSAMHNVYLKFIEMRKCENVVVCAIYVYN